MRQFVLFTNLVWIVATMMMGSITRIRAFTTTTIRSSGRTSSIQTSPSSPSPHLCMSSTSSSQKRSSEVKTKKIMLRSTAAAESKTTTTNLEKKGHHQPPLLNLYTISKDDLQQMIVDGWGYPRYRADQVYHWIRERGVVDPSQMDNLPKKLRNDLIQFSTTTAAGDHGGGDDESSVQPPQPTTETAGGALELVQEQVSPKDGTIKRLYRLRDGYLIESVLMPYEDGRWTSCISSQAGCAQGCVFCATGKTCCYYCFYYLFFE